MSILFQKATINHLTIGNRFIRSATWEGLAAADGTATEKVVGLMGELAAGGVGLVVSGHAYVRPEGKAGVGQLGIHSDALLPGLRKMAAAVHASGGKIVAQLAHAGTAGKTTIEGPAFAISDIPELGSAPRKEMSIADLDYLVRGFAEAAGRARAAGFDGVQIHAAHGYLLSQSLSPRFNRRTDDYGGTIANRSRLLREVFFAVRKAVGRDYPVLVKMNCADFLDAGLTLEDAVSVARLLADAGIDAIEISGGTLSSGALSPWRSGIAAAAQEAYFRSEARFFREAVDVPLILVGGMRSFEVAEALVTGGTVDFISFSRPFLREPGLIRRWEAGDRSRARCISCNQCFTPGRKGEGVHCVPERENR